MPLPHRSVSRVRIEIEDTGVGIAPEDQERIFNRFYRVENLVHTLEGTGLGLSIVKNIIDKHHSQIHIRSELGKGTCFWFDLGVFQEKCDLEPRHLSVDEHGSPTEASTNATGSDIASDQGNSANQPIDSDLITT
jgi:two-component system sensor histidine kinase NblS